MKGIGFPRIRAVTAAGLAAVCVVTMANPASATFTPDSNDWGTVVPDAGCVQADAWIARVEGLGSSISTALFESHYPATPNAPDHRGGGSDVVDLTVGGIGLGKIGALFTRAAGNKAPVDPGSAGTKLVDKKCAAFAESGGGSVTVGIPYMDDPKDLAGSAWGSIASGFSSAYNAVANVASSAWDAVSGAATSAWNSLTSWFRKTGLSPQQIRTIVVRELQNTPEEKLATMDQGDFQRMFRRAVTRELRKKSTQRMMAQNKRIPWSPIGVHIEAITTSAYAQPGKAVDLRGGAAGGYISSFGMKLIDIPKIWPVNFGLRIPADYSTTAIAQATTNEQVTTDSNGVPTLNAKGKYFNDPTATSGFVTGIHASVLGSNAADATVAHAAVLRDGGSNLAETPACAVPNARCK